MIYSFLNQNNFRTIHFIKYSLVKYFTYKFPFEIGIYNILENFTKWFLGFIEIQINNLFPKL